MSTATYTEAREHLAELWDKTLSTREPIILKRRGKGSVSLIPTEELSSLMETAHLLRSPANARRLLAALQRSRSGKAKPMTLEALKAKFAAAEEK
jgi:antitoxin YefM